MERKNLHKKMLTTSVLVGACVVGGITTEAALGDQPLSPGMRHQDVKELQDSLRQKGFFAHHTSTGFYGDLTRQAVERFQQANQLPVTGLADTRTLTSLTNREVAHSQAQTQTLRVGSRGQAVTNLQTALKKIGVFRSNPTGYYGPITETAVREFQLRNGLTSTGVADAVTIAAISRVSQGSQQTTAQQPSRSEVVLSVGSRGQAVVELQKLLDEIRLFKHHTHTGFYGEVTAAGVREFQKLINIPITGKVDNRTIDELRKYVQTQRQGVQQPSPQQPSTQQPTVQQPAPEQPSAQQPTTQPEVTFILKVGSSGEAVSELQNQLKALGFFRSNVTGYFGPITEDALKRFQQQHGLIADGIATSSTLQRLTEEAVKGLLPAISLPSEMRQTFNVINVIADASQFIGVPYLWGGTTSTGFDCSGFIQHVFQKNSVQLPRTVAEMWQVGQFVDTLQVGDLVFFETYMPGPSHAGIYIGNNQFIHSSSSHGVTISNLSTAYYQTRYLGAKRYQ